MRVALLTNNHLPPREGIGRHVLELAKRLPAQGVEPLILAKGRNLRFWQRFELEGVPVALYPYAPVRPFHQEAIRAVLQPWLDRGAEGADLLHLHLPLLPCLKTPLPRLVTFHSPLLADTAAIAEPGVVTALVKANARLFGQAYEHAQIRSAAAIIAVSGNVRHELARQYRMGGHEPVVIGNGVDVEFFAAGKEAGGAGTSGQRTILYVGRLGYRKGLARLLDAMALLADRPDCRLALAGEGPLQGRLEAQAHLRGIADRVDFLGFLDREALRRALHDAAVLVNPADYESGPLTLLEAMAAGTPVVTTPTGLVGDLTDPAPLLVAEPTSGALAAAIRAVLDDPPAAAERAQAAQVLVRERFAWDHVAAQTACLYQSLVRRAA
jgi:glycosyltransferase involved in cell wall biosynthesis